MMDDIYPDLLYLQANWAIVIIQKYSAYTS